jgi:hypothetical protein
MLAACYPCGMRLAYLAAFLLACDPTVTRAPDAGPVDPCAPSPCAVVTPNADGGCAVDLVPGCAECTAGDGARGTSRDGGPCCVGCWAGPVCKAQADVSRDFCGANGALCRTCLTEPFCLDGACSWGRPSPP